MLHVDATDPGPLMGVAVGAVLATMGGFLGGQIENRLNRKERERSAALLFGELLAALQLIIRVADNSRARGDPYGRVTLRIVRAAQREAQLYDRNRENLFAIRDAELRARTHVLMAQMILTLDGVMESSDSLRMLEAEDLDDSVSERLKARIEALNAERQGSFDFLMELHVRLPELVTRYEKIAGQSFEATNTILRRADPLAPDEPPAPA